MNNSDVKSGIVMIPIDRLNPHPDNPRKDVGDVTELAESIKVNGVLQNLTVVPYYSRIKGRVIDGLYTVIIGHRRLAAAQAAGIKELPCVIADMTEEEQLSTMLTENMQRADLTIYEQAKSFQQLSMDFGMSVQEISKKSGFSESTVRKRTKLAELDEKSFKRACERGATLYDFAELDKVEDPEEKQKCLEAIGTPNFKNVLRSALDDQRTKERIEKWIEQLKAFAIQGDSTEYDYNKSNYICTVGQQKIAVEYVRNYGSWSGNIDVAIPDDVDSVKYYFVKKTMEISLYREWTEKVDKEVEERKKKRDREEAEWSKMQEIIARHKELRRDFILNFDACKSNSAEIMKACSLAMLYKGENTSYYSGLDKEDLCKMLGITYKNENGYWHVDKSEFNKLRLEQPERVLLITTYWYLDSCGSYVSHDWNSDLQRYVINYKFNQQLDDLYYFLEALGYERSDEERQIYKGTHELFNKDDDEEE